MRVTEKKLTLTLLFLSAFLCSEIFSQKFLIEARVIGMEDGLPTRDVFDIVRDNEGFIWVCTRGAISRYDGERFKTYNSNFLQTLERNPLSLAVDKFNRVWYCEWFGLVSENFSGILDTKKDSIITFESLTDGLFSSEDVLHIKQSKVENEILISTRKGKIYKSDGAFFEEIFQAPLHPAPSIFCQSADNDSYWVFNNSEVLKVKNQAVIERYSFSVPNVFAVKRIPHPTEFIVEAGIESKISQFWKLEGNTFIPFLSKEEPFSNPLMTESEQDEIFYTNTKNALLIKDYSGKLLFKLENFEARGIFKDKKGLYWLNTNNGLVQITIKENPFTVLQKGGNIRGIYKDENWLCIGDYLGNRFENLKTGEITKPLPEGRVVMSFSKDENGHIWAGSHDSEFLELKPGTKEWISHGFKDFIPPYIILNNSATGNLLVGSVSGIYSFDLPTKVFTPINLPGFSRKISTRFFHQNDSGIWAATSQGIYLIDPKTEKVIKRFSEEDGMPNINITHIHEDAEGIFWLASKTGGLIRWDVEKNSFLQFTQENGLFNNTIYAVYEDDFNNLWLPSNFGLMCFDKKSKDTRVFLPENGIPHEEFNTFAHFKSEDGTMFFGGLNGVIKFHPKDLLKSNDSDTPLLLIGLRVLTKGKNNFINKTEDFQIKKQIALTPNDQVLELDLAMLDYESSDQNQFAYQIEGYQNQWIYTKDSKLSIIKPPYGNFQLNIKGRTPAGTWSEEMLHIPLFVSKPFYLKNWFLLLLGFCLLGLVYAYFNRRVRRLHQTQQLLESEVKKRTRKIEAQTEDLKALDKVKTQFFSNITHEFRTPLTLIIGPTEQMISGEVSTADSRKKLSIIAENARHLLTLINQLLDLSKLEGGSMKKETSRGDIVNYTEALVERFQSAAIKKKLKLNFIAEMKDREIIFDKKKWNKIVYNLISNAEKFTPIGGSIDVSLTKTKTNGFEYVNLSVSDTGIGIEEKNLSKIFDRFYQADNSMTRTQEGTGIGLSLVKELVEFQNGKITVSSETGKGTEFTVSIPVSESVIANFIEPVQETALHPPVFENEKTSSQNEIKIQEPQEKFSVLIIDDHENLRGYIRSCLDESIYEISEAADGEEALEKALTMIPDLIISDVMMPKKDGFELLQDIRREIVTSHIPVVLLTAKASLNSRLQGLESGADAYLTKPFSPQELVLRVQKLIEIRRNLQKRYSNGSLPVIKERTYEKEDEFITKLRSYILENIENADLNGEVIGKHFFISRGHLHRKLKALTGQSISEYVRTIRLKKAVEFLNEKKWRISEITDKVGFSSISHFSRAFKKEFGKSPSKI